MSIVCPLSGSSNVVLVEEIKTADLAKIYNKLIDNVVSEFSKIDKIGLYHCIESDLRFFYPFVTGSENFYEKLQQFKWYYMGEKPEYDYATKHIKALDSVLEIGCGKGAFAKKISTQNYVGLEFSQQAKHLAALNQVSVINESIQDHAAANQAKYDVVCAFQVLEHVADINSFISSSIACLKPGGLLIYSVPSADSFARYVCNFTLDMPPHHVTKWSDRTLKNLTNYFPIENLEIWHEPLQNIHRGFYAKTILQNSLFKIFKKEMKNIDLSLTAKLIDRISGFLGMFFAKGLTSSELLPRGISVTSVYRKLG